MRPITKFALHSALASALAAFAASSAAAAAYMKFGSIKGEVAVKDGKLGDGWIEIDSYQWGAARGLASSKSATAGGSREASSPSVSDIAVTKVSDAQSASLDRPLARGSMTLKMPAGQCMVSRTYPTATVDTGTMRYEMENVMITSCSVGSGGGGGGALPMEEISFNYEKISTTFVQPGKDKKEQPFRPKWETPKPKVN